MTTPIYEEVSRIAKDSREAGRLMGIAEERYRILQLLISLKHPSMQTRAIIEAITGEKTWQQDLGGPLTKLKQRNAKNGNAKNG